MSIFRKIDYNSHKQKQKQNSGKIIPQYWGERVCWCVRVCVCVWERERDGDGGGMQKVNR